MSELLKSSPKRRSIVACLFSVSFAGACGSSDRVPNPVQTWNATGGASWQETGGAGGASEEPGSSESEHPDDASGFGGAVSNLIDFAPRVCPLNATWINRTEVASLNHPVHSQALLSLTGDELTFAFVRNESLYVADRSSTSDSFEEKKVNLGEEYDPSLGVSLSQDGLTLLLTFQDGGGFARLERDQRTDKFDKEPDASAFSVINSLHAMAGAQLTHPTLSPHDNSLWWVESRDVTSVWKTSYGSDLLARGTEVGCNEYGCDELLTGTAEQSVYLNALSSDGLSIFLSDVQGGSLVRQRAQLDSGFLELQDLGDREHAQPNQDCSRLYFDFQGKLYVETRK